MIAESDKLTLCQLYSLVSVCGNSRISFESFISYPTVTQRQALYFLCTLISESYFTRFIRAIIRLDENVEIHFVVNGDGNADRNQDDR